jgi:hypothetical protein
LTSASIPCSIADLCDKNEHDIESQPATMGKTASVSHREDGKVLFGFLHLLGPLRAVIRLPDAVYISHIRVNIKAK